MKGRIFGIGNCQIDGIARCAALALGMEVEYLHPSKAADDRDLFRHKVQTDSVVFATRGSIHNWVKEAASSAGRTAVPVIAAPRFHFAGFHPDAIRPKSSGSRPGLPLGDTNSAILLAAWREGLSEAEAISLFREEVYDALGYFDMFALSEQAIIEECASVGFDAAPLLKNWRERGPFAYMPLHPKIHVLADLSAALLRGAGLYEGPAPSGAEDQLARSGAWPIYPEIAERLGFLGDYIFWPRNSAGTVRPDLAPMNLETFVERTYSCWRTTAPETGAFHRLSDARLQNIRRFVPNTRPAGSANPYKMFGAEHWWSKAVAETEPADVDPVRKAKFKISQSDKVATAGSCFAQHLSKRLREAGFNYLVTESAPPDCPDAAASGYGVFTARFGNLQTVRQLLQLAQRAYGDFEPAVEGWAVPGGYVDPFRPRIEPAPFASLEALRAARQTHFKAVREMFEECDVFVFTLGLTEGWRSKADGAIVPLPPGVVGAEAVAADYVPINFTVGEIIEDLQSLVGLFLKKNPQARILLTVSPVPLIATHQKQHVLEATTYSKSALRTAAGEVANFNANVAYFPSYEIITGSYSRGRYFAEDLRRVTDEGVDHVMRIFLRHFAGIEAPRQAAQSSAERFRSESQAAMEIICDEEEISAR